LGNSSTRMVSTAVIFKGYPALGCNMRERPSAADFGTGVPLLRVDLGTVNDGDIYDSPGDT
jgi:hypothetical protein